MKKKHTITCPVCGGSGQVRFFQGESRFLLTMEECLECNGTGLLEQSETTGKRIKGKKKKQGGIKS